MQRTYIAYQQNQVMTAPGEKLVLMLFEGLCKFTKSASNSCRDGDIEHTSNNLVKAEAILSELISSLNPEVEISENLAIVYEYMYRRLVEANVQKDADLIDEIHNMAVELRDTWLQAAASQNGEAEHYFEKKGVSALS